MSTVRNSLRLRPTSKNPYQTPRDRFCTRKPPGKSKRWSDRMVCLPEKGMSSVSQCCRELRFIETKNPKQERFCVFSDQRQHLRVPKSRTYSWLAVDGGERKRSESLPSRHCFKVRIIIRNFGPGGFRISEPNQKQNCCVWRLLKIIKLCYLELLRDFLN